MGYNFSMINYDTIANGVQGSMNLFWNQAAMHSSVYPSLFMTPTMNFGSFSPYSVNLNNNWLLDPGFALNNAFNQFGMQCPWTMNGGIGIGGGGGSTAKTDEELDAEEKKKELNKIISELISAKILTSNDKKKIDNAAKESKEAGNDLVGQYEAAKAKFDELISGKENAVKTELLEKGDKLKLEDGTTILAARKNLGIGEDLTALDTDITAIENIVTPNNILEYIEEYQEYEGNIIDSIIEYGESNNSSESGNAATAEKAFKTIQTALRNKAISLKSSLTGESRAELQDAINEFEACELKGDENGKLTITGNVADAFKKLYAMTRVAVAMNLDNQVKAKYGKHSELFNKDFYKEKVLEDLAADGYDINIASNITVDETVLVDIDSLREEEREIYEAEQEAQDAIYNTNTINEILTLTDAYECEERENGIYKLTPTSDYKEFDKAIYYYNSTNGRLTKANSDGNYDQNGAKIGLESFKNKVTNTVPSGSNCLDKFKNKFTSEWIKNSLDSNKKKEVTKLAGDVTDKKDAQNKLKKQIQEIANQLKSASFLSTDIIDSAAVELNKYYDDMFENHIKLTEDKGNSFWRRIIDGKDHSEAVTGTADFGRGNGQKIVKYYEFIEEDDGESKRGKVEKKEWNYETDTGISIVYDDDGIDSWDIYINNQVLVKKFEIFLSEEIKNAKDNVRNS